MKKTFFLLILLPLTFLNAEKLNLTKSYRGITFYPVRQELVESVELSVPKITQRFDTIHQELQYPITFFRADCKQETDCFSLLIDVSIIGDSIKSFEEIIAESKLKDFRMEPRSVNEWKKFIRYKTEKMEIYYGPSEIIGGKVIAFYYHKKYQKTYRLTINMIYTPNFSDKEWNEIINFNIGILNNFVIR